MNHLRRFSVIFKCRNTGGQVLEVALKTKKTQWKPLENGKEHPDKELW